MLQDSSLRAAGLLECVGHNGQTVESPAVVNHPGHRAHDPAVAGPPVRGHNRGPEGVAGLDPLAARLCGGQVPDAAAARDREEPLLLRTSPAAQEPEHALRVRASQPGALVHSPTPGPSTVLALERIESASVQLMNT